MADTQRRSVFPLLGGKRVDPSARPVANLHRYREDKDERPRSKKTDQAGNKTKLLSLDNLKKEQEREAMEKKYKKAEALVREWEGLVEREKEHKHSLLQQRIRMQRKLISKNEELANELRQRAEEEQTKKIESRRAVQREVVTALRSHMQRVAEHKRQIADKLQSMVDDGENAKTAEGRVPETSDKGSSRNSSPHNSPSTPDTSEAPASVQAAPIGTVPIEVMWRRCRDDASRRIQPTVVHSLKLKQMASPSVKQCMEVYDQPTVHDCYTGKPIPLSEVVREMEELRPAGEGFELKANLLGQVVHQNQDRAQALLHKKGTINPNAKSGPASYIEKGPTPCTTTTKLPSQTEEKRGFKSPSHRAPTSARLKKQLPSFYSRNGELLSGSVVELGEGTACCVPSRKKSTKTNKEESFFLTQLPTDSKHNTSTKPDKQRLDSEVFPTPSSGSVWLPLSSTALSEYRGVSEIAVTGQGHLAHGQYSLWRPRSSSSGSTKIHQES